MPFNRKDKKESKAEHKAMQANAKRIAAEEEAYAKGERARSEALMKPVEALGQRALGRVEAFDTGKDIGTYHPAIAGLLSQGAKGIKGMRRAPGALGKDPRYNERLSRSMESQARRGLSEATVGAVMGQRAADVGEGSSALGMSLGAGQQRLGTFQQSMGSAGQLFGQAGNLREAALAEGQASFNNLMAGINAAVGVAGGVAGVSQARSLKKIADKG